MRHWVNRLGRYLKVFIENERKVISISFHIKVLKNWYPFALEYFDKFVLNLVDFVNWYEGKELMHAVKMITPKIWAWVSCKWKDFYINQNILSK